MIAAAVTPLSAEITLLQFALATTFDGICELIPLTFCCAQCKSRRFATETSLNKVRLAAPFYFGPKAKLQLIDATIRFRIHIFQSCLVFPHYRIRCPKADVDGLPRREKQNTAPDAKASARTPTDIEVPETRFRGRSQALLCTARWAKHAPCGEARPLPPHACPKIAAEPVLGGLDHIYHAAA